MITLGSDQDDRPTLALAVAGIALSAHENDAEATARLRGAVAALRESVGSATASQDEELERRCEPRLINALGDEAWMGSGHSAQPCVSTTRSSLRVRLRQIAATNRSGHIRLVPS
jgi:hypothetical protein